MRILLYIPQQTFSVDANKELVTALNVCLNENGDISGVQAEIAHAYSPQLLNDINIVHIFGCWNHQAAQLMQKATKANIPTVFSPLGGLEPWTMKGKAAKRNLQTNLFQRRMTRQASAVHVAGKFENEMFTGLRWNPRVSIIKNPALTSLVSNKEMARQMLTLYQKVLDSNVYTLMSQQAATAMTYMLQAATCPEIAQMPTTMKLAKEDVEKIDATDWRNICIYAHDEHISDIIAQGAAIINPELTMIEVDNAQRFAPSNKYSDKDLKCDDVLSSNIMLKSKVEDIATDEQQIERELCMMVLNIKHELAHNKLPLRHIANLATRLNHEEYDEDVLATMLEETSATLFMARLEAAMTTITRLTEGFMPIKPIFDKQADAMTSEITKLKNIAVS